MTVGELKTVLNKFDDETKIGIVNKAKQHFICKPPRRAVCTG